MNVVKLQSRKVFATSLVISRRMRPKWDFLLLVCFCVAFGAVGAQSPGWAFARSAFVLRCSSSSPACGVVTWTAVSLATAALGVSVSQAARQARFDSGWPGRLSSRWPVDVRSNEARRPCQVLCKVGGRTVCQCGAGSVSERAAPRRRLCFWGPPFRGVHCSVSVTHEHEHDARGSVERGPGALRKSYTGFRTMRASSSSGY